METTFEFPHPSLGTIRGLQSDSTNRFLALQYATLRGKFHPPIIAEAAKDTITDATRIGPAVPSFPFGLSLEFSHIQKSLPSPDLTQSDRDCLHLNVTVPFGTPPSANLPVLVFLHGGGFAIGSNAWPQYDFCRIVELSGEIGSPVIGVTINYRLGAFGFLTSDELRSHGFTPNNGLSDQRVALLWIQKHIGGFGGDPESVTVMGQSAGGVSVTHHLESKLPLFKRMMSMSGTNLMMQPLPQEMSEKTYKDIIDRLKLGELTSADRVKALTETSTDVIMSVVTPEDALRPSLGGDRGVNNHSYDEVYRGTAGPINLPGREWCKDILIGDSQMDASILSTFIQRDPDTLRTAFNDSLARSLRSPVKADEIVKAYGITENLGNEDVLQKILEFANDIGFFVPVLNYAHLWSGSAYVYNFNEPNTWEGRWKGCANHILDVAYLYQNFNEELTDSQRSVAVQFAKDVISFAHGKPPWTAFKLETGDLYTRVYGGKDPDNSGKIQTVKASSPITERRGTIIDLQRVVSADDMAKAWGMFMAGF